jgi:hypothetical protein
VEAADAEMVHGLLGPSLQPLFFGMEPRDQRHAIEVTRRLQAMGVTDADLLTAALLHDCGKGDVPVWLRIAKVLMPGALRALSREGNGWRGAAYRLLNHEAISARLASETGAPVGAVRLIAGNGDAERMALLYAADDRS